MTLLNRLNHGNAGARRYDQNGHQPRVLHIIPALFGSNGGIYGGAERYALELARYMAEVAPTTLVSFGAEDRREKVGNLWVRVIGQAWHVRGQQTNPFAFEILPELRSADVVHCHQPHVLVSSLAALASRLSGRRVFTTELGGGGWDVSTYVSTDRWFHGHLHISQYSRETYGHASNRRAHVIGGGVDTEKFSPAAGIQRDQTVLYVGRVMPHKGINDLIDSVEADTRLKIIGHSSDPRFLNDLRAMAKGKNVSFHHDYDDEALVDAYRRALCIVLPSVYRNMYGQQTRVPELLGQTLLEAMACGAPVICTNVASMPEVVEDGVTGFVVPPNDPATLGERIRRLREQPDLARQMGTQARARVVAKFTWPQVVQRCLDIYSANS